jgi:hypothetical protein
VHLDVDPTGARRCRSRRRGSSGGAAAADQASVAGTAARDAFVLDADTSK